MTIIQKANYYLLVINILIANAVYFYYFYNDSFSLDTIWMVVAVTMAIVFLHVYQVFFHVFLQTVVIHKEKMLLRNDVAPFMDTEHFYYDASNQIHLAENAPQELIKEVNDYIKSYNEWLEQWKHNKKDYHGNV